MRICCLIDSLGSGGAQRQMTWLVRALKQQGHDIHLLTYFEKFNHFLPDIQAIGIEPENVDASSRVGRFWNVRRAIRKCKPDCIISFLNTPNLIGVFASLPPGRIPIIVSERSLEINGRTRKNSIRFNAFRMADRVVTNSQAQAAFIHEHFAFLKKKTVVIRNCVDLDKFHPEPRMEDRTNKHLLVAASVIPVKNTHRLIEAVRLANIDLENSGHPKVMVKWFGNNLFVDGKPTAASSFFLESKKLVEASNLQSEFRFHDTVSDIHKRFAQYDGVCLPSLFEGCPNIVCEAMAAGKPILASNISDLRSLFDEPDLLFEPKNPEDIAEKICFFAKMTSDEIDRRGEQNRATAELKFAPKAFADSYNDLVHAVAG